MNDTPFLMGHSTELREKGYTMIVGDATTVSHAKQLGMNVVLIISGENSVKSILRQVIDMDKIKRSAVESVNYLRNIKETMPGFMGIYSMDGKLLFSNNIEEDGYAELRCYIARCFDSFKS